MAGNPLRRLAPAIAIVFLSTLLATSAPAGAATVTPPKPAVGINPDLPTACGLDFVLVLDTSGSIAAAQGGVDAVKNSAKNFLNALIGTGSSAAVVSFAEQAHLVSVPVRLDTIADATAVGAKIDLMPFGGSTNWQDALLLAKTQFGVAPFDGSPELVVMITDGNPTVHNGDTTSGGTTGDDDLFPAMDAANVIKADPPKTHMFALGVGSGINSGRLQDISGTEEWVVGGTNFSTADWAIVTDFAKLADALKDIATQLCGGTVTVEKRVDNIVDAGWTFAATGGAVTANPVTGVDGKMQFKWNSVPPVATTITETVKAGYAMDSAECKKNGVVVSTQVDPNGASLTVGPKDIITCVFMNRTLPAGIHVVKSASSPTVTSGSSVTYTYVVTNTGQVPLSSVSLTDVKCPPVRQSGDVNSNNLLDVTETWTYTCAAILTATTSNTANVSGTPPVGSPVTDTQTITVTVLHPAIHVVKSASSPTVISGSSVTYTYVVTNTGDTPLSAVSLTDLKCPPVRQSGDVNSNNLLDVTETWTYTCAAILTADTLNTANVVGTPPVGSPVTATAFAVVDVVNPNLHVTKTGPAQAHEGDTITYTFTVTNTGDVTLTGLNVVDDLLGPIGTIESLAEGASMVFTKTYTVKANQIDDVVNTVVVCTDGPAPGAPENAADLCDTEIHVLDVLHPGISITKTANPGSVTDSGLVTFTYVVTNTGDVVLSDVSVDDDVLGHIGTIASLEPGESKTLTQTATINANSKLTNIGTARGTDPLDKDVEASDDAVVSLVITPPVVVAAKKPVDVLGIELVAPPAAAPAVAPAAELPRTGSESSRLLLMGEMALLAGLASLLLAAAARRRKADLN